MTSGTPNDKQKRAEYMKAYKARQRQEDKDRKKALMRARSRAMTRLTGLFPEEFEHLLEDEMTKEGLSNVGTRGARRSTREEAQQVSQLRQVQEDVPDGQEGQ